MASKHHTILTEAEFAGLQQSNLMPLENLPIAEDEKAELLKAAIGRLGSTPIPDEEPPVVVCTVTSEGVVCIVHKSTKVVKK